MLGKARIILVFKMISLALRAIEIYLVTCISYHHTFTTHNVKQTSFSVIDAFDEHLWVVAVDMGAILTNGTQVFIFKDDSDNIYLLNNYLKVVNSIRSFVSVV